jgi:hypothetical protein
LPISFPYLPQFFFYFNFLIFLDSETRACDKKGSS